MINAALTVASCQQSKTKDPSDKRIGGGCEGCEAAHEYGSTRLTSTDTLPDFFKEGKKLHITGTIFHKDGKSPAQNVILYIYHTDQTGQYPTKGDETGWDKRHGYIRGWIKTNANGKYDFYTLIPGAYPGGDNPAHIHAIIKEPGYEAYWIDEYLFDDDPILTEREKSRQPKRGGSGILKTTRTANDMMTATRNIILGFNVPGYE